MSSLLQRQPKRKKKARGSSGQQQSIHFLRPLRAEVQKKRKMTDCFTSGERGQKKKEVGGERERAAGNTRPQPCLPPDLSLSPFCRAIKGKTIFSYCFIKHYVALFIAVSPDCDSIPAAAVCTAPERTEKTY